LTTYPGQRNLHLLRAIMEEREGREEKRRPIVAKQRSKLNKKMSEDRATLRGGMKREGGTANKKTEADNVSKSERFRRKRKKRENI